MGLPSNDTKSRLEWSMRLFCWVPDGKGLPYPPSVVHVGVRLSLDLIYLALPVSDVSNPVFPLLPSFLIHLSSDPLPIGCHLRRL